MQSGYLPSTSHLTRIKDTTSLTIVSFAAVQSRYTSAEAAQDVTLAYSPPFRFTETPDPKYGSMENVEAIIKGDSYFLSF